MRIHSTSSLSLRPACCVSRGESRAVAVGNNKEIVKRDCRRIRQRTFKHEVHASQEPFWNLHVCNVEPRVLFTMLRKRTASRTLVTSVFTNVDMTAPSMNRTKSSQVKCAYLSYRKIVEITQDQRASCLVYKVRARKTTHHEICSRVDSIHSLELAQSVTVHHLCLDDAHASRRQKCNGSSRPAQHNIPCFLEQDTSNTATFSPTAMEARAGWQENQKTPDLKTLPQRKDARVSTRSGSMM